MSDCLQFHTPLCVHIGCNFGPTELADVDDGLRALHAGSLGRYRFGPQGCEQEEWGAALDALAQAKFQPRSENTESARSALRTLALAAGALVMPTRNRAYLALGLSGRSLANTSVAQRS